MSAIDKRLLAAVWHARWTIDTASCVLDAVGTWHPEQGMFFNRSFDMFPQDQREGLVAKVVELRDHVRQLRLLLRDEDLRRRLGAVNQTPATVGNWTDHSYVEAVHDFGTSLLEVAAAAQRIRGLPDGKVRISTDPPGEGIAIESDPPEIDSALLMKNLAGFLRLAHRDCDQFDCQATVVALEKEWGRVNALPKIALPPLTDTQWRLLEELAQQTGPISQVDLAVAVGKNRTEVANDLEKLREHELCGPPTGKRKRGTVIFQKGHDVLSERMNRAAGSSTGGRA